MKNITRITFIGLLALASAFGQLNTLVETTTSAAITPGQTSFAVASATGINAPSFSSGLAGSVLYVQDIAQTAGEAMIVVSLSSTTVTVRRGISGTRAVGHASGAKVWVATAANWFVSVDPLGACSTTPNNAAGDKIGPYVTPVVNLVNGREWVCSAITGTWVPNGDYVQYIPPTQCTTKATTATVTNTYVPVGGSNIFVLNASLSAAGTTTLSCNIELPTRITATRGWVLKDIVIAVGSQTTAPTSIGTATLGSVTFPTPSATTQTESTVTPVAAGSTVTQLGPTTTVLTVTTAGAFLTFKYTFATAVQASTDLQLFQFTVPYLQSAAAVMVVNTPGLWVHYTTAAM